jgi:two-component system, NarL family, response regulator YdfI
VTRAVVVAPSAIARAGLEAVLAGTGLIEVVGNVAHWSEYTGEEPDIVVADLEPGAEEFSADPVDQGPSPPTLVLADDPRQPWLAEALRSGVRAVLPRQSSASQILAAIDAVMAGLLVFQPGDLDGLLINPRPARIAEPLTPREIEVLGMLAEGQSNKSIAHQLGISEHTVKFHVNSIMTKLNAGSRTEAVTLGIRQGLIMI